MARSNSTSVQSMPAAFADQRHPPLLAFVREVGQGGYMERLLAGVQSMAHEFGITLAVLTADGQQNDMIALIEQAIALDAKAIIIDHGNSEQLAPVIEQALAANIKVVASDLAVANPAVPEIEQDDMLMSFLLCKQIVLDYDANAQIIYANIDAHLPLVKRDRIWQDFKWRYPALHEITHVGALGRSVADIAQQQVAEAIRTYPQANVVLAMWDEFAVGAERAIEQVGKTEQIKLYSMDINDYDIERMTAPNSPWVATVATDAAARGRLAVRVAVALLADEHLNKYVLLEPMLISQQFLRDQAITTMDTLTTALPMLGESPLAWFDWMEPLLARQGYAAPRFGKRAEEALSEREAELQQAFVQQTYLRDAVRALSTPIMPIFDHVLVVPLVGDIDSTRSQQIMETLLFSIQRHQAHIVIIDVTGVPLVDTAIANHLIQTTRVAGLVGAECILVGISPDIAQTIIQLGVDLRALTVYSSLQTGIGYALSRIGLRLIPSK